MSDLGSVFLTTLGLGLHMLTLYRRKDLSEQAKEKVKPDSQKSTMEKAGDNVTGAGDKLSSAVMPGKFFPCSSAFTSPAVSRCLD